MSQRKIKRNDKKRSDDLDPSNDEFINKTTGILDWAYTRRRPIGLLIFVSLAVSVAAIFANQFIRDQHAESSALLAEGLEATTAVVAPPNPEADAEGTVPKKDEDSVLLTFDSSKARATEMLSKWQKVVSSSADSEMKPLGELGTATAHFELGEYDKAIQEYEKFLADKKPALAWLRPAAMEGLGYALEASGKLDDARKKFETLMGETQGEAKRTATYQAGRLAQLKGDQDGAKKMYQQVLDSYKEGETPSRFDLVFVQSRTRLLDIDPKAKVPDLPAGGMGAFDGMDPRILRQLMQAKQGAGAS